MEAEIVDIITRVISTLGFPIFVAVWLLLRTDSLIRKLTESIDKLQECMVKLEAKINDPK